MDRRADGARSKKLRLAGAYAERRRDLDALFDDGHDGSAVKLSPEMAELGWPELDRHPREILDAEDQGLLGLWQAWRGGGMGAGYLPFAGGVADQPACVLAAFGVMSAAAAAVREERGEGR